MLRLGFQRKNRLLCMDLFDRADATVPGRATIGAGWVVRSGSVGIVGNKIAQTVPKSIATINSGNYDFRMSYKITSFNLFGLCFRYTTPTDYFIFRGKPDSIEVFQVVADVATQLSSFKPTGGVKIGDVITSEVRGNRVLCYHNGMHVGTTTLPEHTQSFLVGVRGSDNISDAHLDNLVVEVL